MNKGVKKVRQSIEQRKKTRGLTGKEGSKKQLLPPFPQEEEKHGYFPSFSDTAFESNTDSKFPSGFMLKGVLSAMLFFGVALLGQTDAAFLQKPKEWTSNALTEEFPFASVNVWYQETFGSPLALTPQDNQVADSSNQMGLPVSGDVTETFQVNGTGIMIAPQETADVSALRDGVVIFAGNDRETNNTVVVQHADGSNSTYGHLSAVDVHLYQFVTSNQRIGQFTPTTESETVYFAIEQENDYIDPVQVIQVDDAP
ncbi:M23 family metallopeptidase [Virgibacillus sp. NKC19-16]|uniref:M23 family metallopeptidase n=1 Tax=Virgibacillus salidurans TaxID=2831673 RepID=UPI001F39150C|nr:M23 family metallopeptidase [Virgibacillus sp. NKC19-16]UJL44964.1 M23 family metallopeptidase [Virgibacillus sp. NKC19-16]